MLSGDVGSGFGLGFRVLGHGSEVSGWVSALGFGPCKLPLNLNSQP